MYILFLSTKEPHIYKNITKLLAEAKHKVWENTLSSNPKEKASIDIAKLMNEIKKADAIVVEATDSNFELGRFMTLALLQHKPVLMLQDRSKNVPLVLGESRLVTQATYDPSNTQKLKDVLNSFFKVVAKQRLLYRFNFMMNKEMNAFVGEKAQEYGISKADYIRTLIMENMENEA